MPPVQQQFDLEVGQCHDMVPIERAFLNLNIIYFTLTSQDNTII